MGKVKGQDVVVYIQEVGTGKCSDTLGCARSVTFDIQQDLIETSITGSGRFRTYVPGAGSVSATLEGLVGIMSSTTKVISGNLTRYAPPALPPVYGFVIDIPDLCFPVGETMDIAGTTTADGTYTIVNYTNYGGGTLIITAETVPSFSPSAGTITYAEFQYTIERMYDALIAGSSLLFEFYETDDENHYLRKTFSGFFESISEVASFDNMVTYTANVKASGLPTIEYG